MTVTTKKPVVWGQESCDRYDDPVSGARIIQLTSAAAISNNIYGEQPYCSPDGNRLVIARCQDFCFDEEGSLLVHELSTLKITMLVKKMVGVRGVFNNAWSGLMYYWTPERKLMRLSLMTLDQEEVYAEEDPEAPLVGSSVSPDQRYIIGMAPRLTGPDAPIFQIIRLDITTGKREVILEHPEICNPHLQFNPATGKKILVQNNRGVRMNADGSLDYRHSAQGTTLFVINDDGSNLQYLPVGSPITATSTGHECFVADTGKVLTSVGWQAHNDHHWTHDSRHPMGNILTAHPGDEQPTVFQMPEFITNHVCVSKCGKYFVADACRGGIFRAGKLQPFSLVVGNLETGKYRVLVDNTMCSGGGNQCTHTHQYFTADNRHVIYNSDLYTGIPQVYAARLPEDFLAGLD